MSVAIVLRRHQVSSSKTFRSSVLHSARCMGRTIRAWFAVCSVTLHLQCAAGAKPHFFMDEYNRPTPVGKLNLAQAALGKPISTGWILVMGMKTRTLDALSQYSMFHL